MNLGQLQTAVQALGYGSDTATQQAYFLNAVYREVCSSDRWPFLESQNLVQTMSIGSNTIAIPTDLNGDPIEFIDAVRWGIGAPSATNSMYDTDNVEPQVMRSLEVNWNGQTGTPEKWSLIAGVIHVWPWPDQVYTLYIDYTEGPADLVSSTDTPVIPARWHDVLVFGAAKYMAQRERDIYSTETWDGVYEQKLQKMRQSYFLRQRQTSSTVAKSGFYSRQNRDVIIW
jgi:hypothetical protein